jgi:hypothetical protein
MISSAFNWIMMVWPNQKLRRRAGANSLLKDSIHRRSAARGSCRFASSKQVGKNAARRTLLEVFDVENDLVPNGLHGFYACPSHVRRDNYIGAIEHGKQRIVIARRFAGQAIETNACDEAELESFHNIHLVHQAAATAANNPQQSWGFDGEPP